MTVNNRLIARTHARSAVELALKQIANNASWRTAYANNVETAPLSLGSESTGTVSWKLSDADGSLTDVDTKLRLHGIGRLGSTVQVSSLQIQAGPIGPTELKSYTDALGAAADTVNNTKWYAQYFKPSLPAEANGWRVSSIEIYSQRGAVANPVTMRIYRTSLTSGNVVDSVSASGAGFPNSFAWYPVAFSGAYWLNRDEGTYLTLEASSAAPPITIRYRSGGVTDANSALVQGPPWGAHQTDKALLYRIHGYYTTSNGITAVAGTWEWEGL